MSAQPPGIACSRLVVCRGDFRLGPVDLELAAGQIACLVGPNGSGKTTLLKTIMGLIPAVSGEAAVHGVSTRGRPTAVLRELGYAADGDEGLIGELTATELWDLHALVHTRRGGSLEQMRARARMLAQTLDFVRTIHRDKTHFGSFTSMT